MQRMIKKIQNSVLLLVVMVITLWGLVGSGHVNAQTKPDYAIFELPVSVGYFGQAWKINNQSQIAGKNESLRGNIRASIWEQDVANATWIVTDLGTFENETSSAWGINEAGVIVGEAVYSIVYPYGFRWEDGVIEYLPTLGGTYARANGINNQGIIVGESRTYDDDLHAYVWDTGNIIDLGVIWANGSWAEDINDSGLIAGYSIIDDIGHKHAVIWYYDSKTGNVDGPIDIDGGDYPESRAEAVNNLNQVVGFYRPVIDRKAFIWDEINGMAPIHTLPNWPESVANDINDYSIVVGRVYDSWNWHGFVWDGQGMTLLERIIPPNSRWTKVESALGINDLNQIVGYGQRGGGFDDVNAYIMTPVNPTLVLRKAVPGIAGQVNSIEVHRVTPGTAVYFTYGWFGGGALIPGCDVSVNALQIDNPKFAGFAVADENGVAKLTGKVPGGAKGRQVLFQAVVVGKCEISNLVVQRFE